MPRTKVKKRHIIKFNEKNIASLPLPPKPKQVDWFDTELKGFSVRVSYAGKKVYQVHTGNVRIRIEDTESMKLKVAKQKAKELIAEAGKNKPKRLVRRCFPSY